MGEVYKNDDKINMYIHDSNYTSSPMICTLDKQKYKLLLKLCHKFFSSLLHQPPLKSVENKTKGSDPQLSSGYNILVRNVDAKI